MTTQSAADKAREAMGLASIDDVTEEIRRTSKEKPKQSKDSIVVFVLGLTVVLAKLFPLGSQAIGLSLGGMYGSFFGKGSPVAYHLIMLGANYLPALVVAMFFVRMSHLRERLPLKIPGRTPIFIGLVLIAVYLAPRLFASIVPGGGAAFTVSMFAPFLLIPADILIVVGVFKGLLATLPNVKRTNA